MTDGNGLSPNTTKMLTAVGTIVATILGTSGIGEFRDNSRAEALTLQNQQIIRELNDFVKENRQHFDEANTEFTHRLDILEKKCK